MKKILSLTLALLVFFNCFCFVTFAEDTAAENNTDFAVKAAEIIKNDDNEAEMLRIIGRLRSDATKFDFPYISDCVVSDDGRFVLQFSTEENLKASLDELNKNPDVIYAERDVPVYTGSVEESAEHLSWGVKAIEANTYSQSIIPSSGNSVTVAIVDSGCEDIDFIKNYLVEGYDFFNNDSDATDDTSDDSHGTFLASIVVDCVGNLPIKIMPVRVLNAKEASLINVVNGIIYAVDNGADVINVSLYAVLKNCKALEDAVAYAEENNVTVVVSAGNSKNDVQYFCPSHCETALTVASVNSDLIFSESFSNFGNGIDLAAPGENISGYNASGETSTLSGTSMSAAFVSAAAAMYRLDNPDCNTADVRTALTSSAKDLGASGKDICYGWGIPKLSNLIKPIGIKIKNNFGEKIINYGETLRLTAETTNKPENTTVWWYVDGIKSGEGDTFEVAPKNGSVWVTAKLVNADGTVVKDIDGKEISDSQAVTAKSGFFQKLISFFKDLFRLNRTVIQSFIR